jgi:hypothetical protein
VRGHAEQQDERDERGPHGHVVVEPQMFSPVSIGEPPN